MAIFAWLAFGTSHFFFACQSIIGPDNQETGICTNHKSSPFVLPYPVCETYLCIQGYGELNHHSELRKYAGVQLCTWSSMKHHHRSTFWIATQLIEDFMHIRYL